MKKRSTRTSEERQRRRRKLINFVDYVLKIEKQKPHEFGPEPHWRMMDTLLNLSLEAPRTVGILLRAPPIAPRVRKVVRVEVEGPPVPGTSATSASGRWTTKGAPGQTTTVKLYLHHRHKKYKTHLCKRLERLYKLLAEKAGIKPKSSSWLKGLFGR